MARTFAALAIALVAPQLSYAQAGVAWAFVLGQPQPKPAEAAWAWALADKPKCAAGDSCTCGCKAGKSCSCVNSRTAKNGPKTAQKTCAELQQERYEQLYDLTLERGGQMHVFVGVDVPWNYPVPAVRWDGFPGARAGEVIYARKLDKEIVYMGRGDACKK